ncbi:MAG: UDP-N-acetylglucosamine--N-acetylmuramyl-(pentapeptide) pyrophosphoryl-undecaprenol N-acetylglucosamine transferase [Patescibacteria group bacterium]
MKNDRKKRIVLAGGGSGGHVMPLLNVWELLKNDYDFIFMGKSRGDEEMLVKQRNIPYHGVWTGKWRRYWSWRNVIDLFTFPMGIWQSIWILYHYKPDLVFAKGGYVSLPVAVAARILGIKLVLHESDSVFGLANRLAAGFASKIAVSFPVGRYDIGYHDKMIWTGMPVRNWRVGDDNVEDIRQHFAIDNDLPVVLVTGGSQGAMNLNTYVMKHIVAILEFANVIHIAGKNDFKRVEAKKINIIRGNGKYIIYDFMYEDYDKAMILADMVVSRAGSTLAEISNLAKPSILVPLPHSASNHQYYNAKSFEDVGASVMVEERDFERINLAILVESILGDEERYEEMSAAAVTAIKTEGATQMMADLIVEEVENI